ncbi:S8 family serine peptidase [Deinococcus sp. QL22]|uniref:S8 family peptidase n=1 Tax=Deinococcus sp. QL22 TaxID=2939437 RepID=UPI002017F0A8|nr:S8 family serine peptidase [Deinococcus sp. QL22]UQN08457.1 S8 family serine peptidase [Deinococcus sp. QL22]
MLPSRRVFTLTALTAGLLMGCTQQQGVPSLNADRPGQVAQRYDSVVSVPLQSGDTPGGLTNSLGGEVLAWNETDCVTAGTESCFALLGMNGAHGAAAQRVQTLSAQRGRTVYMESNRDVFSGGGTLTATMGGSRGTWAGGDFLAWTGGSRGTWAGGVYNVVPENSQNWRKIRLEQAHKMAPNLGLGITVAVIDTGVDLRHSAFQGSLSDPSTWRDFYAADNVPQEEGTLGVGGYGHGTNVAGIVLQVAPKAKIMPLRVLGPDGSGDVATVASAIDWATAKGARIINLSLGSDENSKVVQEAVARATAKNVLVVSSAGNANQNQITYPAAIATLKELNSNSLSVGSVDLNDLKSSFSNYASELELVAPGENVFAPAPGELLAAWSGTSQAAPMVTGGLALALGQTLSVSLNDVTKKLAENAFDVYNNGANQAYKDKLGVKGRLDLVEFLNSTIKY